MRQELKDWWTKPRIPSPNRVALAELGDDFGVMIMSLSGAGAGMAVGGWVGALGGLVGTWTTVEALRTYCARSGRVNLWE